jgi:hypothetical protein
VQIQEPIDVFGDVLFAFAPQNTRKREKRLAGNPSFLGIEVMHRPVAPAAVEMRRDHDRKPMSIRTLESHKTAIVAAASMGTIGQLRGNWAAFPKC